MSMSAPLLVLCLAMCLSTGLSMGSLMADDGYEIFPIYPGSRYKLYREHREWIEAMYQCESDGGGSLLAVINSEEEAQIIGSFVDRLMEGFQVVWMGVNDIANEGQWLTVQGGLVSESGYDKWGPDQPRNDTMFNCGYVYDALLYCDAPCYVEWSFICEKPNV